MVARVGIKNECVWCICLGFTGLLSVFLECVAREKHIPVREKLTWSRRSWPRIEVPSKRVLFGVDPSGYETRFVIMRVL
jgi:hypothetical protein